MPARVMADSAGPFHDLGLDHIRQGRLEEAITNFRKAVELEPGSAVACYNLGCALQAKGHITEAIDSYRRAAGLRPDLAEAHNNLGIALQAQGLLPEAMECFRRAIDAKPAYAEAHMNLGTLLWKEGDLKKAEEGLRHAIALKPDHAEAHNNLGSLYLELGRTAEAEKSFEEAIRLRPGYVAALLNYSRSRKFDRGDLHLIELMVALLKKDLKEDERSDLNFALGKICGDCGMFDESFIHYAEGNRIERKKYVYEGEIFSGFIDRLRATFSEAFIRERMRTDAGEELPLFIVGMPRSGTTLVEQIISCQPLVHGAGELKLIIDLCDSLAKERKAPYPECAGSLTGDDLQRMAAEHVSSLRRLGGNAARVTDKMPANFLHLGMIALLFPKAKVIHCRRDPIDTCLSIFFQKFGPAHPYAYDLNDLGHYYREYERLMDHWRSVLPAGMMLEIRYEDLVERPEEMSRRLIEFCGLEWDDLCLRSHENGRAVTTASSWQVRQPVYKTSNERWRRYEKHLGPLIGALEGKKSPDPDDTAILIRSVLERYRTGAEGEKLLGQILRTTKDRFDALNMLGSREGQRGNYAVSEELFRHALMINDSSADVLNNLSIVLMKQGKLDQVIDTCRRLTGLQPGLAMAHYNLGIALRNKGRSAEAMESFRKAAELRPDHAEAYNNLGLLCQEAGNVQEAETCYKTAIRLKPDYAAAHNNIGILFQETGRIQEACESYETATRIKPDYAEAFRHYTSCRNFPDEDSSFTDRLKALLQSAGTDDDRSNLHFALGKVYGDRDMHDEAFLHYLEGNRLERRKYSYDRQSFSSYMDRLMDMFGPGRLSGVQAGPFPDLPVFVVGMPRSGTTLIEQIISGHPLVHGAGELNFIGDRVRGLAAGSGRPYPECLDMITSEELTSAAEAYIRHLRGLSCSAVRVTDKMPSNFIHLGLISILFPKARVIHCMRDRLDTCLSIFFQKFTEHHPYSCDLVDLGHYYREYERLMKHWREVLPAGMMLEVQYEEVVERPEEMSRRLIEFCGLEWDDRCLDHRGNARGVRTASSWQVRQPIYKTSRERWRRYEKHLIPLMEALEGREP